MLKKPRCRSVLAFLIAVCFIAPGLSAAPAEDKPAPAASTEAPPKKLLRVTLRGEVFESEPPFQLFAGALGANLRDLIGAIRKAGADSKVAGLVLRLKEPAMGWTQAQALRRALLDFKKCGKPSYCHLDSAGLGAYFLASACSEVSLLPTGILEIPGLSMELLFMKGLLDKLGIRFQELRMGRYKSAAESFTRTGPSDAVREEMHSLLDELFDDYVDAIAENRSLKAVAVRGLIDRALYNAEEAKAAGLIDRLEYEDEFLDRIRGQGEKAIEIADAKLGKSIDLDLSGFAGIMKLLNELLGGQRKPAPSQTPKLALIYGVGPIMTGRGEGLLFGGGVIGSDEMVKLFRGVRGDDSVKAVVFRIDSPGGSALASDQIWREVKLTAAKKPVVVSMGNTAASGGYYIACPASWIVAEKSTLTGSIGVIGAVPSVRELFDKIGLSVESFSRGKRAEIVSPYGELTDEGRDLLLKYMREVYDDFIGHVADGRKLPRDAVASIAEGRVWTGGQALKHGLVDQLGGLDDALRRAREMAPLPEDAEIVVLPRPKDFLDFLKAMSGEEVALQAALRALPAEARALLRHLEWTRALGKERVFMVLPETIRVRY